MHNDIPLSLAALIAVAIIVIGRFRSEPVIE